jgi:site-specific DNA-methyltransferase (adenine-specific)
MTIYFQDDYITLYHADCLEEQAWLQAEVLVTDPPYGMNRQLDRAGRKIANDATVIVRDQALSIWGGEKPGIVFGHWQKQRPANITHLAVWNKMHMSLGAGNSPFATSHEEIYLIGTNRGWVGKMREQTVLNYPNLLGDNRPDHPTPKPIPLMEHLINKTVGIIADPFAGSGSTLLAARNLGRKAIGIELEEKYCELIANRLSQQTFDFSLLFAADERN